MLTGLHHVGYVVPDLDKAIKFYTDTLGMTLTKRVEAPQMGLEIGVFRLGYGSTGIELMKPTTDTGMYADFLRANPNGGLHHVAYRTDRPLDQAVEKVKGCGLQLANPTLNGPIDAPPGWRIVNVDGAGTQGLFTQLGER
jgi:methylmalonyl-CoA/ethylmalonyl-CoA epimerase